MDPSRYVLITLVFFSTNCDLLGFLFKVAFVPSCSNFDSYTLLIKDGWIGKMYVMHSLIGRKKIG